MIYFTLELQIITVTNNKIYMPESPGSPFEPFSPGKPSGPIAPGVPKKLEFIKITGY